MNTDTALWLGLAVTAGLVATVFAVWKLRGRSSREIGTPVWPLAFVVSAFTLVTMGSEVLEIQSSVTAVDVAALSIAGILTGTFLGLWLKSGISKA